MNKTTGAKTKQRSELEDNIVFEFHKLALHATKMLSTYAASTGLTARETDAILTVWQAQLAGSPMTASALAENLGVSRAAVTYLTEKLEKEGYLSRSLDPNDRRRAHLTVSDTGSHIGSEFVKTVEPHREIADILAPYNDDQVANFLDIVKELTRILPNAHAHRYTPIETPTADRSASIETKNRQNNS